MLVVMPTSVSVAAPSRPLVANGHPTTLKCEASSSNPPPRMVWRRNGVIIGDGKTVSKTKGEHGGVRVVNELSVTLKAEDDKVSLGYE